MSPAALRRPLDPASRVVDQFLDRQSLPDKHIEITATDADDGVALFEATAAEIKD